MAESVKKAIVLVVEDDVVDVESIERGVAARGLPFDLRVRRDGQEAIDYLRSEELSAEQRKKLIVLLDINMPGMDGHQFLDELRTDERLRRTLVFVVTTSDLAQDKAKAYDRNVAGYFVKGRVDGLLDTLEKYHENVEFPPVSD